MSLRMTEKTLIENRDNIRSEAENMGVDLEWASERRKVYLRSTITVIEAQRQELIGFLAGSTSLERGVISKYINYAKEIIEVYEKRIWLLKPTKINHGITDEMIMKAKQSPISELLTMPVRRNLTNCIAHDDKNPSMNIKGNFAYCYACGFRGDSISVYMRMNDADFKTAVENLN
ncbi:hypothetical protein HN803_02510 [candidate division WWE3 bacterium]|nr:hypothetical protein [candidate division WWE3 bacterium]